MPSSKLPPYPGRINRKRCRTDKHSKGGLFSQIPFSLGQTAPKIPSHSIHHLHQASSQSPHPTRSAKSTQQLQLIAALHHHSHRYRPCYWVFEAPSQHHRYFWPFLGVVPARHRHATVPSLHFALKEGDSPNLRGKACLAWWIQGFDLQSSRVRGRRFPSLVFCFSFSVVLFLFTFATLSFLPVKKVHIVVERRCAGCWEIVEFVFLFPDSAHGLVRKGRCRRCRTLEV